MYIDSHCHLNLISESTISIKNILQNATSFKISKIVQASASLDDFSKFLPLFSSILNEKKLEKILPEIYFTFGASPNDLSERTMKYDTLKKLFLEIKFNNNFINNFIKEKILIAIGEIGLDYFHNFYEKEIQIDAFKNQLKLAKEFNLPAMLHIRDAFDDAIGILKSFDIKKPIIFHCYSGNIEITEKILSNFENIFFSFSGNITYKKLEFLRKSLLIIPKDKILIETDAPFLAPIPYRGKDNMPWFIIETYKYISELTQISLSDLQKIVLENFNKAFEL